MDKSRLKISPKAHVRIPKEDPKEDPREDPKEDPKEGPKEDLREDPKESLLPMKRRARLNSGERRSF